jgi:HAD superfamily hydrolase (TIGR01509 family)
MHRSLTLVGVATSASKKDLGGLLTRAAVYDLVDICVSGDAVKRSKPDPDIIISALQAAGVGSEDAMLIGDTPYDIEAAARAGVACIGV